jgi:hypothetical protein
MFQDTQNKGDISTNQETLSADTVTPPILPPIIPDSKKEPSIQEEDIPQSYPSFLSEANPYTTPPTEEGIFMPYPSSVSEDTSSDERFRPPQSVAPEPPVVPVIPVEERTEDVSF